ncbi:MAG TPA: FkbM family methyltransferase [Rhizomicrobium sp.]|nr:FkbM family methyltransferase [Rhizomicrobium sp.]
MFSAFEPRIVRQDSCGVRFNCVIADRVGELWYDNPRHEQISAAEALSRPLELDRRAVADWKEMGILRDHLVRLGDWIVECGCHHGLTTIMLASWTGERGFVFAFDAVPLNTAVARRNLELNGIENAAAYCAAIGGKTQLVNCFNESNVVVKPGKRINPASTVMVRLEDVAPEKIDVLKLDVEGCELDILESSAGLLRRVGRLAVELHVDLLPPGGVDRVLATLSGRRLHVLWEDGTFEPYTGQNLAQRVHLFSF